MFRHVGSIALVPVLILGLATSLVNFGDAGFWEYANDAAWRAIHPIGPEEVRLGLLH